MPKRTRPSVNRSRRGHSGVQLDLPECALILRDILLQDRKQRLGLLRAHVDTLEIVDLNLRLTLLLQCAKDQEEVPDAYPHLHAVGITLTIIRTVDQLDIRLHRNSHSELVYRVLPKRESVEHAQITSSIAVPFARKRKKEPRNRVPDVCPDGWS